MTTNNDAPPPPPAPQQEAGPPATSDRPPRGNGLAALAMLVALAGVGLHFHPYILGQVEQVTGPQPWIKKVEEALLRQRPQSLPQLTPAQPATAVTEQPVELEAFRASLADLQEKIDRLQAEPTATRLTAELVQVGKALEDLSLRQAASEKEAAQQLHQVRTVLGQHEQRLAVAAAPQGAALLVARLALVSVKRALTATDVEQLTAVAARDPALSEAVATLKTLAGEDIPSLAALRTRFADAQAKALSEARSAQLPWWQVGISSARSTMSDWGIARPTQESRDDLVVAQAQRRLDLGDIRGALFELDAASPELKNALALWLDQAHLRLALDDALFQLVDAMIASSAGQQPPPQGNG